MKEPPPPPVTPARLREIARHAIRPTAEPRVAAELHLLASWLDDVAPAGDPTPPERGGLRVVK